jgi:hypothetical protein
MYLKITDELFLGFETICSSPTGLWYGQEELGYPALFILQECYTKKYLCSRYFSVNDFTTVERIHLNRLVAPCGSDSAAQSFQEPPDPS